MESFELNNFWEQLKEELIKKVRDKSQITYESLKRDVDKGTVTLVKDEPILVERKIVKDKLSIAERFILCSFAFNRPYLKYCNLENLYFSSEIRDAVAMFFIENDDVEISSLNAVVGESGLEELDAILTSGDKVFNKSSEEKYFIDCVNAVKRANLESKIKALNKEYSTQTNLSERQKIAENRKSTRFPSTD